MVGNPVVLIHGCPLSGASWPTAIIRSLCDGQIGARFYQCRINPTRRCSILLIGCSRSRFPPPRKATTACRKFVTASVLDGGCESAAILSQEIRAGPYSAFVIIAAQQY